MVRRGCILLAMLAMMVGTVLTASTASASPRQMSGSAGDLGGFSFVPGGLIHLVGTRTFSHGMGTAQSTNWSGYAATTGTYTTVSASWTQPTGHCNSWFGSQYSAFWVGLDGYTSSSVEQTGSEVDCNGRTPQYYAWYEAYPAASVTYSNTVRPGDVFNATVTYEGNNVFNLYIDDVTQKWSHNTPVTVSGAARTSAEVIAEAPCCTFWGGILPLANFGTINFTGSTANGSALGGAGGLTEITMVNNFGQAKDQISALTPAGSGGENFSATWLRSS